MTGLENPPDDGTQPRPSNASADGTGPHASQVLRRALAARAYPLPDTGDDSRFCFGLIADLADVLVDHGYPHPQPRDLVHLMQVLFSFLYRPRHS